jgi:hypothetical protein
VLAPTLLVVAAAMTSAATRILNKRIVLSLIDAVRTKR